MAATETQANYIPRNNSFYRNYYHQVIIGLMILIVLMLIAVGVMLYQMFHRPLPAFSAMQPNNQEMQLKSFDEPNLLPDTLIRWATKGAIAAYTFDFYNYNAQIEQAKPYFTDGGWRDYRQSVNSIVDTIVENQLFISGVVSGTPVISNQGPLPGKGYTWRIQIPFLVTYQSANTTSRRNFFVTLIIVRVPTTINPQGIGIDQFIMRQG